MCWLFTRYIWDMGFLMVTLFRLISWFVVFSFWLCLYLYGSISDHHFSQFYFDDQQQLNAVFNSKKKLTPTTTTNAYTHIRQVDLFLNVWSIHIYDHDILNRIYSNGSWFFWFFLLFHQNQFVLVFVSDYISSQSMLCKVH